MNINDFKTKVTEELKNLCNDAEIFIKEEEQVSVGMKITINDQQYGDYVRISYEELEEYGEEEIAIIKAFFAGLINRVYEQDFYNFIVDSMFNGNCEDDVFCEACLRKLEQLGYVEVVDGEYCKKEKG